MRCTSYKQGKKQGTVTHRQGTCLSQAATHRLMMTACVPGHEAAGVHGVSVHAEPPVACGSLAIPNRLVRVQAPARLAWLAAMQHALHDACTCGGTLGPGAFVFWGMLMGKGLPTGCVLRAPGCPHEAAISVFGGFLVVARPHRVTAKSIPPPVLRGVTLPYAPSNLRTRRQTTLCLGVWGSAQATAWAPFIHPCFSHK